MTDPKVLEQYCEKRRKTESKDIDRNKQTRQAVDILHIIFLAMKSSYKPLHIPTSITVFYTCINY